MKTGIRTNVIVNLIRTITLTVLSFISFPYICRILGDNYLGVYTWANTFVYYFLIIAKISIPNIAVRECVRVKDNPIELAKRVKLFFIIQGITTVLSFVSLLVIVFSIPGIRNMNAELGVDMGNLIFLLSVNFISGAFSFEWVYIALEKHLYMAIRSIIIMMISALFIFSIVRYQPHVYIYSVFTVGVTVLTVLTNCLVLPKYIKFKGTGIASFKPYIKPILILFFISIILTLYNETDIIILGILDKNKAEVGSQSVALKGIEILITIITSLSAVFMPRASDLYNKGEIKEFNKLAKFSVNICFFIAVPAIATMAAMSTSIVGLIGGIGIEATNELEVYKAFYQHSEVLFTASAIENASYQYVNSWLVLVILLPMILTYSICDIIYSQILIPQKKEKIYLYTMLGGTLLTILSSILLALTLFRSCPVIGVAIATTVSDILVFVYLMIKTKNESKAAVFNINNLKIVIVGAAIFLFTVFVGPLVRNLLYKNGEGLSLANSLILELIIMVAIDAVIYLVSLKLMKESIINSIFKKEE